MMMIGASRIIVSIVRLFFQRKSNMGVDGVEPARTRNAAVARNLAVNTAMK
jgi:hypothetical protein